MPGQKSFVPKILPPVEGTSLKAALAIGVSPESCKVFKEDSNQITLCARDGRDRNVFGLTYQRLSCMSVQDVIGVIALRDSLFAVQSYRSVNDRICDMTGFRLKKVNDSLLETIQAVADKIINSVITLNIDSGIYTAASTSHRLYVVDGRAGLKQLMRGEIIAPADAFIEVL
jgi:hypothetical protein